MHIHRCAEREAGYTLLGALICSWEGAGEEGAGGYMAQRTRPGLSSRDSRGLQKKDSLARDSVGGPWRCGEAEEVQQVSFNNQSNKNFVAVVQSKVQKTQLKTM